MVRWLSGVDAALGALDGVVDVFLRDDDAGWADERLLVLLDLLAERRLPVDLAVIPAALGEDLARELRGRPVGLHQHGLSHANHEREGRKHEFGPSRSRAQQRHDIEEGRRRLERALDGRLAPIFTPPWNRCTEDTARCLAELGFQVLSRESRAEPFGVPGLRELPVHLDYVRLSPEDFAARLAGAVARGGPVGLMFHHAEMDGAGMARAAELFDLLAGHAHVSVQPMMDLAGR
jgi:hypothetical protein